MSRKSVDTLIIDLDNTLFDWFAVWYASFEPIYSEINRMAGQPVDEVEAAIRRVHQTRRTSEYTFLLEEVDVLQSLRTQGDIRTLFHSAIDASRRGRDQNLKLYPSVFTSLWDIKRKGTKIVAYTESMGFYSAYRLKRFGLDGVIDVMFSPEDHAKPEGVSVDKMRRLPEDFYELQVTKVRHTPPGELKPNPRVLLDLIKAVGTSADRCAYVGDSLFKDVAMARDVGVYDIHAQYGESQRRPEYALLQRVSHWTDADVQREKAITAKGHTFPPSAVLKDTFAEIYMHCDFVAFPTAIVSSTESDDEIKNVIEIWKKCVDVQQHFNDLEMRIRNFAVSFVGVLIAAVGFTYQQKLETTIFGLKFAAGLGLVVGAIFAWTSFFLMDRFWYHILLKGSVKHALMIESAYTDRIPSIGLGKTISEVSGAVKVAGVTMNSDKRLTNFYLLGFGLLGVVFVCLLFAVPLKPDVPTAAPTPVVTPAKPDASIQRP